MKNAKGQVTVQELEIFTEISMPFFAASFRFKHLFLCGSLVLHVGSDWEEFFYPALKPWVHYVPVEANASQEELASLLEFLQAHDAIALKIATNGQAFIKKWLTMKAVKAYWTQLIKRYAEKLTFVPSLDFDTVPVTAKKHY